MTVTTKMKVSMMMMMMMTTMATKAKIMIDIGNKDKTLQQGQQQR
jgi:hypothetical protein